jgi:hypothetical protein
MPAGLVERQGIDPQHGLERKFAVQMGEQRAAARRLPFQLVAERVGIDRDQRQVALAGEPFRRGLRGLLRGREVDEPVRPVDGRAAIAALALRLAPFGGGADFVDRVHRRITSGRTRVRKVGIAKKMKRPAATMQRAAVR